MKAEVLAELRSELQSHSSEIHKAVVEPQMAFGDELRKLSDVFSTIESLTSNPQEIPKNLADGKMGKAMPAGESIPASICDDLKQATKIILEQKGLFLDNKNLVDAAVEDIKRFQRELAEQKEQRRQASVAAKRSGTSCMGFLG